MDVELRRLIGEAVSATATAAPRVIARWIVDNRREAVETMLVAYVREMFGWRAAGDDRHDDAPRRQPEPAAVEELF